jgi:hypothetical protein
MSKDLTDDVGQLTGSVKRYIQAKLDLLKLTILEKATKVISIIYVLVVLLFFSLLIFAVGIAAFVVWFGETYNDFVGGLLIAGGGLIALTLLLTLLGKLILSNTIIRIFSAVMFKDDKTIP